MKPLFYCLITLFMAAECRADVPPSILKKYKHIIQLVKSGKAEELAAMVQYPLKRPNPLPDIANAREFVADYNILVDETFKKKLQGYSDADVMENINGYGLVGRDFSGELWLNDKGKISALNYSSKREEELKAQLTKKIQSQIYPAVNSWTDNVLVCTSNNLLIRIDRTSKGLRYVSWSKGRTISEKPDLILYNGIEDAQGSAGGWTWTFRNGDWTYIVDDAELCESADQCGYFLRLEFKGVEKNAIRLKLSK